MPNEITLTSGLSHSHSGSTLNTGSRSKTVTVETTFTVQRHHFTVQNVGTSREAMSVGDVDTAKDYMVALKNLDGTNFVKVEVYDSTNYVYAFNIEPGEPFGPVRVDGGKTLHLTADAAACSVEVAVSDAGDPTL